MNIEIDQSGKVEQTDKDTVLAFSNGKSFTVKIKASTKRRLQEIYRRMGTPRLFVINTLSTLIFILIKDYLKDIKEITIDVEYAGKQKLITEFLKELITRHKYLVPEINFQLIGKHSKAHQKAIEVFRKKSKPDQLISLEDILKYSINKPKKVSSG